MRNEVTIITRQQLLGALSLDLDLVDIVEAAFAALAGGDVIMPPVLSMDIPSANGEVDIKTAYIPGFDGFAVKISPGFFDNPKLGLASLNGLMILLDAKTGMVRSVFLDNGYLTDLRTAAASAVAARHLAPQKVETAGVIGTGLQARLQMQAAFLVRPFEKGLVYGRSPEKAAKCAAELSQTLGIPVQSLPEPADLVAQSQLVITATASATPVIKASWLHPGLHITAMGTDQEGKNEIDPRALIEADAYICDRLSQCAAIGELRSARDSGLWTKPDPAELGDVITGAAPGRRSGRDITICDLTGTGAQDTAIATHADALLKGAGTTIRTDK